MEIKKAVRHGAAVREVDHLTDGERVANYKIDSCGRLHIGIGERFLAVRAVTRNLCARSIADEMTAAAMDAVKCHGDRWREVLVKRWRGRHCTERGAQGGVVFGSCWDIVAQELERDMMGVKK